MRMRWYGGCLLVMLFGLTGCRARVETTTTLEVVPEDTTTHLSDKTDISLADWLKLPRPELAKLVEEWTVTVGKQREFARSNVESVGLLPGLHPPAMPVVFAEAKFSPAAGFSLPPYLKEGQKDAAVALHLARFGDHEAALKLADSADKDLLTKIDSYHGERDYPIEWTRLTALVLQNAELKLANGEPDGATELVQLHRQLRSLLDGKTASGVASAPRALSAALLPRGRQALTLAAVAWREPRRNKTALAADLDAALADWGASPDPLPGLNVGAKRSEVVSLMGGEMEGKVVLAHTPAAVQRAVDLLALPLPSEGINNVIACLDVDARAVLVQTPASVQRSLDLLALPLPSEGTNGVIAFLDDKQTLTELFVLYRPKINELFPEPRQLALPLVEHDYKSGEPASAAGLTRQSWTGGGLSYEVAVLTRGSVGGAIVQCRMQNAECRMKDKKDSAFCILHSALGRDFGAVNLDRSFEQNRLNVAADRRGASLEIKDAAKLASIRQPAATLALADAVLVREAKADLLAKLTLRWPADRNNNALSQLVPLLWAAYGPTPLESVEDISGGSFVLTWRNETTRLTLRLPFEDKAPELIAEDSRGAAALPTRIEAAAELDRRERQQRLDSGKPRESLTRAVQLPSHGIDNLSLGMTRRQVQAALPDARSLRIQPLSDGLNILFLNEPPTEATYWPRQLFVRFGADNRVAEIRVRYQEGPKAPGPKAPSLLDTLKTKANGVPESLPASWAGLWTDLPARKPTIFYRWLDDVTCLTYQRDFGGSEVVLRDCPPDKPQGVELPPLLFCGRGVAGCALGDSQADVRKRWHIDNPLLASNGDEVLRMPDDSPYDVLLVRYENGKVSKLIARQREPKTLKVQEIAAALQNAWGADLDRLGFVRRQDGTLGQVLQAYSYHDDRTRVRLFAQETGEDVRLFTEWRTWPIAARTLAAK